jgi:two-component system, OmpR family, response regulator
MTIKKILLVDDEQDIRQVAAFSLRKIGQFEVSLASSGEEGMQMALAEKPDAIIVDMMMPGMDGMTLFEKLRKNPETQNIPVIFMTAKAQPKEIEEYMARGACGVIAKPFDPMTLPQEIRDIASQLPGKESGQPS